VLNAVAEIASKYPELLILADSRRSLREFPKIGYKMNAAELAAMVTATAVLDIEQVKTQAEEVSRETGRPVFVTLSEKGIVAANKGEAIHIPALPVRGEIDIVGAGDSVTANLTAALAAGAELRESLELAMLASSSVIHQLGTTGTASPEQMAELLPIAPFSEKKIA
jgi:bifunctional ADP-heptose synthase (sugar kinase/adenylyltransferase)